MRIFINLIRWLYQSLRRLLKLFLIMSIANAIGSFFSNVVGNNQAKAFWRMNNAYNHPRAVRKRMEQAGINPALGNWGSGHLATAPNPAPPPDFGGLATGTLQVLRQAQEIRHAEDENDRQNLTMSQSYQLNKLNIKLEHIAAVKSTQQLKEFMSKDNIAFRQQGREYDLGTKHFKFRRDRLELQLRKETEQALREYSKLMPKQEYELLKAQVRAAQATAEYKELINDSQYQLVNPDDPLMDRLIQGIIQELIRGKQINLRRLAPFIKL